MKHPETRASIHLEDAAILEHRHYAGEQHILRLHAPKCSQHARAGQFVHLQCDPLLPLRRPLSIMRTNTGDEWIELLYKDVGHGTHLLAGHQPGESLSMLGPIGNIFQLSDDHPIRLLIGGGVGIPPMIFLAETIAEHYPQDLDSTLVVMGSEVEFPFELQPSTIPAAGVGDEINSAITDLESLNIASRLTSMQQYEGCFRGYAPQLAESFLQSLPNAQLEQVAIYSCGPLPMLDAVKKLASRYNIRCQVSLEETMACAVGGCAGCVVEVSEPTGVAMRRVCVDGPVFDAQTVSF